MGNRTIELARGEAELALRIMLLRDIPGARIVLRTSSMSTLVEAATAGHGIVPIVDCWADNAGLARVLPLPRIAPRPLWLAVGPGQRERPAVRAVADEVARLAGYAS